MITEQAIRSGRLLSFEWDEGMAEHSVVIQRYEDLLSIEQNGNSITIPIDDVPAFLRAARRVASNGG